MNNGLIENDLVEEKEGFKVDSLESANWAFRKLRAIKEKEEELNGIAQAELERINNWLMQEKKKFESDKAYFEGLLTSYYIQEKRKDNKFKISSPYGKISSRKAQKYIWQDEQLIIDYCNMNQIDAIRVKEELDKDLFKKNCKGGVNHDTGEVIPGVLVEEVETISIKAE